VLSLVFADALPRRPPDADSGVWHDGDDKPVAHTFVAAGTRWVDWPGIARFTHRERVETVVADPEPGVPRAVVIDLFHRAVLPALLQAQGALAVHASAIAGPDGVVGFCGRSGVGKSTLAWRLSPAGRQFADDALVLNLDRKDVRARPLPFTPRVGAADGPTGPATETTFEAVSTLKQLFVISRDDDAGRAGAAIERLDPRAAFLSLLPHAIAFESTSRESRRRLFDEYSQLAERVPVMSLRYRHAVHELPALLDDVARAVGLPGSLPAAAER
jgi:hypothetical protein